MKIIEGNILDVKVGMICHQVNCMGVAGSGLAKQIRNQYPNWYSTYRSHPGVLGGVAIHHEGSVLIADLYAQYGYGSGPQTNYDAMERCLTKIALIDWHQNIFFPFGIGCGLGGGDWELVEGMLKTHLPHSIIVKLPDLGA